MDEILPGLWVGGVRAAMDADYLSRAGITHIITCMKQQIPVPPPLPPDGRTISRDHMKHVRIDDEEKAPILVHFAGCNELISCQLEEEFVPDASPPTPSSEEEADGDEVELLVQGRQKRSGVWGTWQTTGGGTVLVHCQAGCSRSVAIVAAYLMRTRQISASTAIGMIAMRRKDAEPNRGFKAQLELYQQVGYEIDMKWQAVRRFLMSKTDILNGDSMDDMLLSYYPSPYPSPALSAASAGIKGFTTITTNHVVDPTSTLTLDQSKNVASQRESKNSIQIQNPTLCPSRSASSSSSTTTTTTTTTTTSSSSSSTSAGARISHLSSIPFQPSSVSQLSTQLSTMSSTTPSTTIQDTTQEVKVTASSSNRLPGGVSQIRGHESVDNRGCLPKPSFKGPKLRCKGCRRELAALDHVVIHEPGKGQLAFDHRKRDAGHVGSNVVSGPGGQEGEVERVASGGADSAAGGEGKAQEEMTNGTTATAPTPAERVVPTKRIIQSAASLASQLPPHLAALRATRPRPVQPHPSTSAPPLTPTSTSTSTDIQPTSTLSSMLKSATCSSYFLEPMAWMTGLNSGQVTGRLNCPTAKCGQKLGSWDWAGMQCACGAWVTPAFSLHRSKVDEV